MNPCEQSEPFDVLQHQYLGKYVYVLVDPRDGMPFYVGQGHQDRVGSHFDETRDATVQNRHTRKTAQIAEIWANGYLVKIEVARRRLCNDAEASHVEGALLQAFHRLGFDMKNKVAAPLTAEHGSLTIEQVRQRAAPPLNPNRPTGLVHLFKIENGILNRVANGMPEDDPATYFDALKRSWYGRRRYAPPVGYAVGYIGTPAVSIVACRILEWRACDVVPNKWAIVRSESPDDILTQLELKNWSRVIEAWGPSISYGNPAQIEFDGKGMFRFCSGSSDHCTWHALI